MTEEERPGAPSLASLETKELMRASAWPIALSALAGVGTALLEPQVGIGIVAGLVVAAIGLQIQLTMQIRNADVDARVKLQELSPIIEAKRLDPGSALFLNRLAAAQTEYLKNGSDRPVVFDLELDHRRTMLLEQYQECARGTMRLNLRPVSILRETDGVTTVNEELKATSVVPAGRYWDAPSGLSYLDQQEAMLERGVRIQRVFIHREASLGELTPVMARHLAWRDEHGADRVDVRVALIETLDHELIADYAIIDRSSLIQLEIQHGVDQPTAVTWHTSPNAVDAALRLYERLWISGRDPAELSAFRR